MMKTFKGKKEKASINKPAALIHYLLSSALSSHRVYSIKVHISH